MISKEEDHAFRSIMESLEEDAVNVERKIDNEKKAKIVSSILALVAGLILLVLAVGLSLPILGFTGFVLMFTAAYFLSTVINI